MNLQQSIFDHIEAIGPDAAAAFFGVTKNTISKWQGGNTPPPIGAAQRILDHAIAGGEISLPDTESALPPPIQGKTIPDRTITAEEMNASVRPTTEAGEVIVAPPVDLVKVAERARQISILVPIHRDMPYATVLSLLGNWKATAPQEVRERLATMDFEPDTTPHMSRNRLATRFLEKGGEWSFWMDSDIIAPIGNANWFKRRTGMKYEDKWMSKPAIDRLTSHHERKFVGAVYVQRAEARKLLAKPRHDQDLMTVAEDIKKGPQDRLVEVDWLGFGCVAVHRQVFLDILEKVPDVRARKKDEPHDFFTPFNGGSEGEDMIFAARARQAGHPPFLDMGLFCAHIGRASFTP